MAGVMDELNELVRQDATIKTMIKICELPLEKVRELAANIPTQPKEPN